MDIEFKQVGLDRLPEIAEVNFKVFDGVYDWKPYELSEFESRLSVDESAVFVALDQGQIVGYFVGYPKGEYFYSWILGVLPEYRGHRIATELMDLAEDYARKNGFKKMLSKVYNVSDRMLRLKLKRGYMVADVQKNDKILYTAVMLELEL